MATKLKRCPECKGSGQVYAPSTYPPRNREYMYKVQCKVCGGTGKISGAQPSAECLAVDHICAWYGQGTSGKEAWVQEIAHQIEFGHWEMDTELLQAAAHALLSYAHGNSSPDLAKEVADKILSRLSGGPVASAGTETANNPAAT